jgi:hypothetical protein
MKFNDLNMEEWKDLDINVDSLWLINQRDKSGKHNNIYHGNFIPQIPYQLISRYTKENETVLDVFMGSGTTLFVCEDLNRKFIGLDINEEMNTVHRKLESLEILDETKVRTGIPVSLARKIKIVYRNEEALFLREFPSKELEIDHKFPNYEDEEDFYCFSEKKVYTSEDIYKKFNVEVINLTDNEVRKLGYGYLL